MLINIVLMLLLIHTIITYVFNIKSNVLCCGIWAWSGQSTRDWNPLTRFKFQLLGVEMDSRGGDGCGIAYDNLIDKSVEVKKFDDFWRLNHVPNEVKYPCIMGHDRKASVGEKTFENTQPIFFEDGDIQSVLSHNGTLYNHEELVKKYKVDRGFEEKLKHMSDSQMLTLLIDKVGWKILNEYIGTAAIVYLHADKPGEMYVYHGQCPTRKHMVVDSEERPLYMAEEDGQLWFCSTRYALEKIITNKSSISEVPFNKVFKVVGTELIEVFEVNRANAYQFEFKEYKSTTASVNARAFGDEYDSYGEYGGYHGASYYDKNGSLKSKKEEKKNTSKLKVSSLYYERIPGVCQWERGMFCCDGTPLHGLVSMGNSGRIMKEESVVHGFSGTRVFYFYHGNLLSGRDAYISIIKFIDANEKKMTTKKMFSEIAKLGFVHPYIIPTKFDGDGETMYESDKHKEFSGIFSPVFMNRDLRFALGKLVAIQYTSNYSSIGVIMDHCDKYPEEFVEWAEGYQKMKNGEPETPKVVKYECPQCLTTSYSGNTLCPTCHGEAYCNKSDIDKVIGSIAKVKDYMTVIAEEAQISSTIYSLVNEGIEVLEEPDMVEHSCHVLNQLNEVKKILKDGRYNS